MYTADITGAHILLTYSDIFKEEKLDLIEIIKSLNMHKVISIIYDILSYDKHGNQIYIEVKTTTDPENGNIFITANELEMSEKHSEQYYLYRVYDFYITKMEGKLSIRQGSLKPLCISAQTYKVNFL